MIDELARCLASQRTLTAAQVDARTAQRCRYDFTPAERWDTVTHRTMIEESRH